VPPGDQLSNVRDGMNHWFRKKEGGGDGWLSGAQSDHRSEKLKGCLGKSFGLHRVPKKKKDKEKKTLIFTRGSWRFGNEPAK